MKNLYLLFALIFAGWTASAAGDAVPSRRGYNDSFIFVEDAVEFAVYPNGEFDFYYNPDFRRGTSVNISTPHVNISYNSGYDYDPYVQYDDYGAVIQIESVPVYYDYYGRIIQAGNVFIDYNSFGNISRIGNLYLHYNQFHRLVNYSGYINYANRHYVYRPWHRYYSRPRAAFSIVFNRPYRTYYEPRRVTYVNYVNYYHNHYKTVRHHDFYRPDQRVKSYHNGRRTTQRREIERGDHGRKSAVASGHRSSMNSSRDRKTASASKRSRTH